MLWVLITGVVLFLLGYGVSYLATELVVLKALSFGGVLAAKSAAFIFLFVSSSFMGFGAGMILHWLLDWGNALKSWVLTLVLAIISLIIGIILAVIFGNVFYSLQAFLTFTVLSLTLFLSSLLHAIHGIKNVFVKGAKSIHSRRSRR